jgi:hypothetical protein
VSEVSDQRLHPENKLLDLLLGTAAHIQNMAQTGELDNPRKARAALEGLRQRMAHDIEAIDACLQKLQ